jgi:hypothetical protein
VANAAGVLAFVKEEHRCGGDTVVFRALPPNSLAHRVSGGVSAAAALARSIPHSMMTTLFILYLHRLLYHERGVHETAQYVKDVWWVSHSRGTRARGPQREGR